MDKISLRPLFRLPVAPVFFAPLILMSPVLLAGRALFWGTTSLQFVPWRYWAWETLLQGHLPLWNPLVGMGAPLAANYQSALFYPPNWFYFLFAAVGGISALAWGQALLVTAHLILAGTGMVVLIRKLGLSVLAQTIGGLAFALSGYLVARAGFLSINAAAAWMPWIMAATMDFEKSKSHWPVIRRLALLMGMQLLAGHAQTTYYSTLFVFAWASVWAWWEKEDNQENETPSSTSIRGLKPRLMRLVLVWVSLAIGFGLAIGIAAIQLIPTAEYLLQSQRSTAVDFDFAMTYSFWPWRFLTLLAPDLFGNPIRGDYWGYGAFWEDAVYIGLLPLLLAIGALVRHLKPSAKLIEDSFKEKRNRLVARAMVFVLPVSFLLALGKNTPIFPWLYRNIPTFDMFQAPTRFSLWAVIALAVLGAMGVEGWCRPEGRSLYWTRLATAGAAAVAIGAGLGWILLGDLRPTFIRATAIAGFWGIGIGILTLLAPSREDQTETGWWPWAVSFLLVVDLLVAGWGLNPGVGLDFYSQSPETVGIVRGLIGDGRLYLPPQEESEIKFGRFFRFDTFQLDESWKSLPTTLLPNINMLEGFASLSNFDPLLPGRYSRWMDELSQEDSKNRERLLNLSAVKVVEIGDAQSPFGVRFDPFVGSQRFRWSPCARLVRGEQEAWDLVVNGEMDLQSTVIVETETAVQSSLCISDSHTNLRVVDETPNRIVFEISADQPGWLLIADVWYPGWRAVVNNEPAPVLRANFLFRAIALPAGDSQVEMAYRPFSFYVGAFISVVIGIGLAVSYGRSRS